jgi:hypothetical protein
LLIALGSWLGSAFDLAGDEARKAVTISVDDLNSGKVVVVGRLGIPLKTIATLRGTWRFPDQSNGPTKDYSLSLHVSHVDGKALTEPVKFHSAIVEIDYPRLWDADDTSSKQPKPANGETWEFRGYETGGFRGRPAQFEKELRLPLSASGVWERSFLTELNGILPKPDKPAKNSEQGKTGQTEQKKR